MWFGARGKWRNERVADGQTMRICESAGACAREVRRSVEARA